MQRTLSLEDIEVGPRTDTPHGEDEHAKGVDQSHRHGDAQGAAFSSCSAGAPPVYGTGQGDDVERHLNQ
jgi:hypothetical protein